MAKKKLGPAQYPTRRIYATAKPIHYRKKKQLVKATVTTPVSVRFGASDTGMFKQLRAKADASKRTLSDQIKYFTFFGMACTDNPDLPPAFVAGVLEGIEESRQGLSVPYEWGVLKSVP